MDSQQIGKDELLGATELPWKQVDLPELGKGKHVIVQGLSGFERDRFEMSLASKDGKRRDNVRARLAARCIVDAPGGRRVYDDEDVPKLGAIRVDVLQRIWMAAQTLSGFSNEDLDELGQGSETKAPGPASPTP